MKNKFTTIFIVLVLLLLTPNLIQAQGKLKLDIIRYEPFPAQPGQYVDVYLQIQNIGNEDSENVVVEITDSFPFSSISEDKRILKINNLKSQQSYVLSFKLRVDGEALVGINKLKVKYTDDINLINWFEKDLDIEIKSSDVRLVVNKVEVLPEKLHPGESGIVTLTIKNAASIFFRDINLNLDFTNLPFIPLNSVSQKNLISLKPNDISQIDFPLSIYPTATPGYYKIPLTISFYDDAGNKKEYSDVIGFIIDPSPELKIVYQNFETSNGNFKIFFKTINKGVNDLKFLDLEILESNDYELSTIKEYYVGDLDSDDYRTADFKISASKDNFDVKIKANYKDENNKIYEEIFTIPVEIKHQSNNGMSSFWWIVILLILILTSWLICSKRKSKSKK